MHRTAIMTFVSSVKAHLKKSCLHSVLRAFAQKRANFLQPYKLFVYFSSVALPNCRFFTCNVAFFQIATVANFKTVKKGRNFTFRPFVL